MDPADSIQKSYTYDAYGNTTASSSTFVNSFAYIGAVIDVESGLYYLNARYYDPATARFISVDPAQQGTNWYIYCFADPVSMADPSGLWAGQYTNGGSAGIYDPAEYLRTRYGGTITLKSSKILPLPMFKLSALAPGDICSKGAITRILYYLSWQYPRIPHDLRAIYNQVWALHSQQRTPFYHIDDVAQATLRRYGYSYARSWNVHNWSFDGDIGTEISSRFPLILNIALGYYTKHSVTVTVYKIYSGVSI